MSTQQASADAIVDVRYRMRHSAAHVMAEAVIKLFPEAQIAIGPPTDDGFYYDFEVSRPFTPEDLKKIEKLMRETIKADRPFSGVSIDRDAALERFSEQKFKVELITDLPDDEEITVWSHQSWEDLCAGRHADSTGKIGAFKLLSVAGAYWRGDENREMLQRIYGTAWESQEELDAYLERIEEAERRDHRRLGRELDLFFFDPIAPASPFFLPKGTIVLNELVDYVKQLYVKYGYQEVTTPQIFNTDLWKQSGHYDNYLENMYMMDVDDREFGVKPMNCPAHAVLYAANTHSYRELPIRYADFGRLHRYERSGVTHGLMRVRTFSQDDAHIFATLDQIAQEVNSFIAMLDEAYAVLGFEKIRMALSLRPEKRVGTEEMWDRAEAALTEVMESTGREYGAEEGEGAFYGPKIDFFVPDALGREWQLGTVQLDFSLPERFDLQYAAEDGSLQRPVVIHRAMLGSLERFLGVLIEHTAGALPIWLSPVQATLIPIADRHIPFGEEVVQKLRAAGVRAEVDTGSDRMGAKIRAAQVQKIPYMLVVGDREQEAGKVAVRERSGGDLGAMDVDEFVTRVAEEINTRA
ncbi:MAG: threonine--tRNA ligase [Chloroflexi bacterium]|nr:threonine--tRNA ligase [Chloroflexota bacterium]MBT5318724.1 threonine--tRNA ligase [Chloroflexota bacterium]MBT6681211.1 threonine--tRNA ligase [Chloroflexota bacterium]